MNQQRWRSIITNDILEIAAQGVRVPEPQSLEKIDKRSGSLRQQFQFRLRFGNMNRNRIVHSHQTGKCTSMDTVRSMRADAGLTVFQSWVSPQPVRDASPLLRCSCLRKSDEFVIDH